MRKLKTDRAELIDALLVETETGDITAALLEKDEHLTDALRAIFALSFEHVQLVFCGGTSLSKGHQLLQRMSEDADIKVVLSESARTWGTSKVRRYLGDEVRERIARSMVDLGFVEDLDRSRSLNSNRYIHSQWSYERAYSEGPGLRPNLQLELTTRAPVLATQRCHIGSLIDRLAGRSGQSFEVPTICVAETLAEKVLSFLRRFAMHRAGLMQQEWDAALVRHIYDVHVILAANPVVREQASSAFGLLVKGDAVEFGRQHPDFAANPLGILKEALKCVAEDAQTREEYDNNLVPLVYAKDKPRFDDAFASFHAAAEVLLGAAV